MKKPLLAASAALALAACGGGPKIAPQAKVRMHYTLTVDGQVVDSSNGKEPIFFVHGSNQIIPGLEEQLLGRKAGEKLTLSVAPEKGYGLPNPQLMQSVPKKNFADTSQLKVGVFVGGEDGGRKFSARVAAIDAESVTLDLNHPLAGKTLDFAVEIVSVEPPKV